ncbi:MAG: S41 family peptidase [Clostridia bacterium]|nr:S41 family peptidase [Clostridia bacterium]
MENNNAPEYTDGENASEPVETSDVETTPPETPQEPAKKGKSSFFAPMTKKSGENRVKVPLWIMIMAILIAMTLVFQTTYVFLTDVYDRQLKELTLYAISANERTSQISEKLGESYSVMDQIAELFEKKYIYDVDYDELAEDILRYYVALTGDKYAQYYSAEDYQDLIADSEGNSVGIGTYVTYGYDDSGLDAYDRLLEGINIAYVMSGTPAEKAGVQVGDVIIAVDGQAITGMYYEDAIDLVKGEVGTTVVLTVERGESTVDIPVVRDNYSAQTVIYHTIEQDGHKIGYIRLIHFYGVTYNQFKEGVEALLADGCEGIIYDLRTNGGGFLDSVCNVLDYILPEGPIVKLVYSDQTSDVLRSNGKCLDKIPMVVLVDDGTASAAELFTATLKDYDYATVIGTKTYGKGCGQNFYALKNGGYIKFTSFLYTPPYSENYDGIGITPDIVVERYDEVKHRSLFYITADEDAQLKAAVENIMNKLK